MAAVDDYFDTLDEPRRAAFDRVRRLAVEVVPEAEQGTSYGMAALKYANRPLLGFVATKTHLSVFPFSAEVVAEVRERLPGFELSKGTIRFSEDNPLPDDVVRDMVRLRAAQIRA